ERRAGFLEPLHFRYALTSAAQREEMANEPEREVVRDDVRAGQQHQRRRRNQPDGVDCEPEAVALEVALQRTAQDLHRAIASNGVGIHDTRLAPAAELPQQPLLGDRFSDPAKRARFEPRRDARRRLSGRRTATAFALGLREHFLEAMRQSTE